MWIKYIISIFVAALVMVKHTNTSDADEKETNRRSILKAGAAGLATLAAGSTLAAANRSDKASDVHAVKGTVNSPVSEKQRKQLRKRAVKEYERNTGETMDAIPASRPESNQGELDSSEESEVVAYAYGIDADGVARGYTGMANESDAAEANSQTEGSKGRAEGLIHSRFEDRVRDISTALEVSDDDVTTQSGGTIQNLENMSEVTNHKLENAVEPYGVISSTYYWLRDTQFDDGGTLHGLHSPMTVEPGCQVFNSGWKNDNVWQRHSWDRNDMAWQEVGDGYWKPAGPSDGGSTSTSYNISVTVGWMTADVSMGMSWSYSEPAMERIDQSSQYNDYCSWQWDVTDRCDGSVRKSTLAMQPSSTCEMEDYDSSMGTKVIGFGEHKARFTSCSSTVDVEHSFNFFYTG